MQLPWKRLKLPLEKASLSLGWGHRESSPAENWVELSHHLSARWTCSGEAVESLLKQRLWGQEKKRALTVPMDFRDMGLAATMWDGGHQ